MQNIKLIDSKLKGLFDGYSDKKKYYNLVAIENNYLRYELLIDGKTFIITATTDPSQSDVFTVDLIACLNDGDYSKRASEYKIEELDEQLKVIQKYITKIAQDNYTFSTEKWLLIIRNTYLNIETDEGTLSMIKVKGKREHTAQSRTL